MPETVLVGRGKRITSLPRSAWERELEEAPEFIRRRLEFMSPAHHGVRNFVVRELPRFGKPLSIGHLSRALGLPREQTAQIVEDLERNLFFLARGDSPEISWAFPVTVDETPHHLLFSTGVRLNAA
jgi:hypothetical protein